MFDALGLAGTVAIFCVAAAGIGLAGVRMAFLADVIADRSGWGEALAGAALLGAATSLPGIVTSVTTAAAGHPELAAANALGGIAAQTAFLALGDITYRRANLEHAAASPTNLTQAVILLVLLAIPLLAVNVPAVSVGGMHPATLVLLPAYAAGLHLTRQVAWAPRWFPARTRETREDLPEEDRWKRLSNRRLAAEFAAMAAAVGLCGWIVGQSGIAISTATGISGSTVGALMTAVVTSLPELVTTLAAIRRGALQLAVGGIIGGNCFDVLFLAFADIAYRDGSLYHAMGASASFWLGLSILMTGILLLGLLHRQKHGPGNIGFESGALLLLYAGGAGLQAAIG